MSGGHVAVEGGVAIGEDRPTCGRDPVPGSVGSREHGRGRVPSTHGTDRSASAHGAAERGAAAETLAEMANVKGLTVDHILPTMDEWEIYPRIAVAVPPWTTCAGAPPRKFTFHPAFARA